MIYLPAARVSSVDTSPCFSIVVPVFDEAPNLPELYRRIRAAMEQTGEAWEVVLVNDGSRDESGEVMRQLHAADGRVRVIDFARNFGHQIAVTAGLDYARGQAVVIMDADLQDPPEAIPALIEKWREGFEVVNAVRAVRQGETWFKKVTALVFYRLINRITNVSIPVDVGDFRLIDRKVALAVRQMRERYRFIRGMTAWVGFRQASVPYVRQARAAGVTKYPLRKMLRFSVDAITGFSYVPLQLATYLGFTIAGLSAIAIPIVIALRLAGLQAFLGQATTLISVLFLGGVQLISLGIIGEYLGRIYDEVKARPLYVVREVLNGEPESGRVSR